MSISNSVDTDRLAPDGVPAALLACFVAMLGLMPLAILPLFVGTLVDDLGITTELAGVVVSINLAGNAVGVLLVSLLLKFLSLKQFVYWGVLLEIVAELLALLLDYGLPGLMMLRLSAGLGGGLVTGAAFNWIATRADPDRGFGILIVYQFALGGVLLFSLPLVIKDYGIDVFYIVFLTTALVAVACAFVLTPTKNAEVLGAEKLTSMPTDLDIKSISKALLSIAFFEIGAAGVWAFVERLGVAWNLDTLDIGSALSIGALAGIPGAMLVAVFSDRWGRSRSISLGLAVCVIGLCAFLLDIRSWWFYTLALIIFNGAWSFTIPYLQGVQAQLDQTGRVAVVGMFVVLLAIAAGPFIFGFLIGGQEYSVAILFASLLLGGCFVSVFGVARKLEKRALVT